MDVLGTFTSTLKQPAWSVAVDVPPGDGRTALLFVHATLAAANVEPFDIAAGPGWRLLAPPATATTKNRRYTAAVFGMSEPAVGQMIVPIETGRPVNAVAAFVALVDRPVVRALTAAGEGTDLSVYGPFAGPVVYAAQARPATAGIGSVAGVLLEAIRTEGIEPTQGLSAALLEVGPGDVAHAHSENGKLALLLAVELGPDEPPPPPAPPREISVIVRNIPAGGSHEVRHVRPGEIVMGPGGIDWDATPYMAYILTNVQPPA